MFSSPNVVHIMHGIDRKNILRVSLSALGRPKVFYNILVFSNIFSIVLGYVNYVVMSFNLGDEKSYIISLLYNTIVAGRHKISYYILLEKVIHIKNHYWPKHCTHISHVVHEQVPK